MTIHMKDFYSIMTNRSEMVLGTEVMKRLSKTRIAIFGVGGVGGWCAESLIRTGITDLTLVDSDIVCPSNINRQIQATALNIGRSKVEQIRKRLLEINPEAKITARQETFNETTGAGFDLPSFDYVIDAIDSLENKVHLIEQCVRSGVKFFSSMGAAAKTDPAKIKSGLLSTTTNCPLAREVRKNLRKKKVTTDIVCVYSDEPPVDPAIEPVDEAGEYACANDMESSGEKTGDTSSDSRLKKKRVNGSLVHVTAIFGFMLAGLIINDLWKSVHFQKR